MEKSCPTCDIKWLMPVFEITHKSMFIEKAEFLASLKFLVIFHKYSAGALCFGMFFTLNTVQPVLYSLEISII